MQNNNHARRVFISNKREAENEESELVRRISEVIIDALEVKVNKLEEEAEGVFDRIARLIYDLSVRGAVPKKDGTTLERRMGQLVSLASQFEDVFDSTGWAKTREVAVAKAAIGIYQFGMEVQNDNAQDASRERGGDLQSLVGSRSLERRFEAAQSVLGGANKRKRDELRKGSEAGDVNSSTDSDGDCDISRKRVRSQSTNDIKSEPVSRTALALVRPQAVATSSSSSSKLSRTVSKTTTHQKDSWDINITEYTNGSVDVSWSRMNLMEPHLSHCMTILRDDLAKDGCILLEHHI